MSPLKRISDIDISENYNFQRRLWVIERVTWVVMLALLILAALGFAGNDGPLNTVTAANKKISVEYQPRVNRVQPVTFSVTLRDISSTTAKVLISRDFMNNFQVQHITPEPDSVQTSDKMLVYSFTPASNAKSMAIDFDLVTDRTAVGSSSGMVGPDEADMVTINQFVYP